MTRGSIQLSSYRIKTRQEAEPFRVIRDLPRFYTLALLHEKPRYGYEIIRSFHQELNWKISPSLVYPFLKGLEHDRLVSVSAERGGRGRRVFRLTKEGKLACRAMFQKFSKMVSATLDENISTCAGCGCTVLGNAYSEKIGGKALYFCCESCASSYKQEQVRTKRKARIVTNQELI